MPEPDVDSIRTRADAASEGPWECVLSGGVTLYTVRGKDDSGVFEIADCFQGEDDAEFIAHAKSDIPALLDALATAREELVLFERIREMAGRDERAQRATITQLRGELSSKNEALAGLLKYAEAVASGFGIIERLPAGHPIRVARAALSTVETPPEASE